MQDRGDGDEIASDDTHNDWAWTYGLGAGALFHLFSSDEVPEDPDQLAIREVYLLTSVRYFSGGEAEYMTSGSVSNDGKGNLQYDTISSPIEQWSVSIRFQGRF